jgi:hypothetical protein
MKGIFQQQLSATMAMVVFTVFSAPQAVADSHIVPLAEIQDKISKAANERTKNIDDIQRVLSYPAATEALKKYNVNSDQMKAAVATLSDAELSRLSDRARASEKDVEAGIIVGILALIGLIVVIIIVVAIVAEADSQEPAFSVSA